MIANEQASVEFLYEAFARYTAKDPIEDFNSEEEDRFPIVDCSLSDVPLRLLPAARLLPFAWHANINLGTLDDYKYFLSRIAELSLTDGNEELIDSMAGVIVLSTKSVEWTDTERAVMREWIQIVRVRRPKLRWWTRRCLKKLEQFFA